MGEEVEGHPCRLGEGEEAEAGVVHLLMVPAWEAWEEAAGEHVLREEGAPGVLVVPVAAEEARWSREGEVVGAPGWLAEVGEAARLKSAEVVPVVVPDF